MGGTPFDVGVRVVAVPHSEIFTGIDLTPRNVVDFTYLTALVTTLGRPLRVH